MTAPVLRGGTATGIGSWPGTDGLEAARTIVGELGELPHLAELPARGVGADAIGRVAAMLVDLPVDTSTTGYRLADHVGAVARRAAAHLARDLDFTEEALERAGVRGIGQPLKVQVAGPVTAATELELRSGRRALTDRGAVRDLTDSLAEGVRVHLDQVRRRFGARPVLQLDEPALASALAGAVPGPTRFDPVRALPEQEAEAVLSEVVRAAGDAPVIVRVPGDAPPLPLPLPLLARTGVQAVALPLRAEDGAADLDGAGLDLMGEWLDAGRTLLLGLVPSARPDDPRGWRELARPALEVIDRVGFSREVLAEQVIVTPERGLADADPSWAREALELSCRIARAFGEDPGEL